MGRYERYDAVNPRKETALNVLFALVTVVAVKNVFLTHIMLQYTTVARALSSQTGYQLAIDILRRLCYN